MRAHASARTNPGTTRYSNGSVARGVARNAAMSTQRRLIGAPLRAAPYAWPLPLASDSALLSTNQGGHQDGGQQRGDQRIFDGVIDPVVPRLHALADQADRIDERECLVDEADLFAVDVLRGRRLDDVMDDPAVHAGHEPRLERPLDVAEQNDAGLLGHILRGMNVGLVEQQILAVAPAIGHAVHEDAAWLALARFRHH